MGRTAAIATALLLVLLAASIGVVSPTPGESAGTVAEDTRAPGGDAAPAAATAHLPTPMDNSTARIVIPREDVERTGTASVQPDLGATLAETGDDVDRRYFHLGLKSRFDAATSTEEQKIVIDQALIDLRDEAEALRNHQHRTIGSYANGTIDESELVRRLARIDRAARDLLETTSYLGSLVWRIDQTHLVSRVTEVEAILVTLKGPVRAAVSNTLDGTGSAHHVYVEATDTALVLSTVDDGTFLREAYVPGNRDEGPVRSIDDTWHALKLSAEYYPWAANNTAGGSGVTGLDDVYLTRRTHVQGEIVAYLDAYSSNVFYEVQYLEVDAMPSSEVHNVTDEGLRVIVERTYPGGPMLVGVYEASTGNPVNARVSIEGVEVGPTDTDGYVRAVEPRRAYELAVETPRVSTNVTVYPQEEN